MKELFWALVLLCVESTIAEYCAINQLPLEKYEQEYDIKYPKIPLNKNLPSPPLFKQGDCGVSKNDQSKQIVNGKDAPVNAWPWQIWFRSSLGICGGSIIHREWIITASHCGRDQVNDVYYGSNSRQRANRTKTKTRFSAPDAGIDLALYKLSSPLTFSDSVQPICFPEGNVWDASPCFVTGWGDTSFSGSATPDILQQLRIRIINHDMCQAGHSYTGKGYRVGRYFCVESVESANGKYAASYIGDSGGPVSCLKNGRYYLLGTVAHSISMDEKAMQFYVSVPSYAPWIADTINRYS
ncbi:chymotrypsinogen B-like [Physella acuta]|uniref:chymotrypsinogen B-like n=1 Tax=Physella acuta TaxID=109671 RepID=UPI0027DD5D17|nr:chymotrypsinogen B-like [Physella acuta]